MKDIMANFSSLSATLDEKSVLEVIPLKDIDNVWEKYFLPKTHKESLLSILNVYNLIYSFDDCFFIPQLLAPLPNTIKLEEKPIWPTLNCTHNLTRVYKLSNMKEKQYCRLLEAFHHRVMAGNWIPGKIVELSAIYQNCFDITVTCLDDEYGIPSGYCRITFDYTRSCISLFVGEEDSRRTFFCTVAEELENLLSSNEFQKPEQYIFVSII